MNNIIGTLKIKTEKFNDAEEYLILKMFPHKLDALKLYREANYFRIHKLYFQGFFIGYVVLFLGYNSIMSNDVLIDDIGYLRNNELLKPLMFNLLNRVKQHKVLSNPLEELNYDVSKFDGIYIDLFKQLDFHSISREVCRA